ncbi:MAG: long-chain fatty acid--CoA ligase, partial [Bacillota bacterium]
LTRGPNIMKEFYNAPEATNQVFAEGWFCTGDIGYIDNNGFLFVTDRKKDLIKKSSGKFVAPGPIESKLSSSPFVDFAVLVGEGRKFVMALIFPNFLNLKEWATALRITDKSNEELLRLPEVDVLYKQIVEKTNSEINPWERIIKYLIIENEPTIASSELTPTMKVRRRVIEKKYKDRIEEIYQKYEHLHDIHLEEAGQKGPDDYNHTKLAS